jgi:hypothetical protein
MYAEEEDSLSSPGVFTGPCNPVFPFLARHGCNIMNLNPMTHGTVLFIMNR